MEKIYKIIKSKKKNLQNKEKPSSYVQNIQNFY